MQHCYLTKIKSMLYEPSILLLNVTMRTVLLAFVYRTLRKYAHVGMFQHDLMTKLGQVMIP